MTNFSSTSMDKLNAFILINIGLITDSLGIYLFRVPNKFATGGVTGIAIIINRYYTGISVGLLMLILNIFLMVIALFFVGFGFGARTIYSSFALSGYVWLFGRLYAVNKPLTDDKLLELIFAMLLSAVGSAIVFYQNASTGGTDIIAKILKKKTRMNIGKTLLLIDFIITIFATFIFGIRIGMYSILGVIIKGVLIDYVIEGMYTSKHVVIVSNKPQEIKEYITKELKRGATIYRASGAMTNDEKQVINSIISRRESMKLRNYIKEIDAKAFVTIHNVSEIIGKGFKQNDL
jgi:uncharacterized membrane-anchored protein YitT (DUF2179 family)